MVISIFTFILQFPSFISDDAISLIKLLLEPDGSQRLRNAVGESVCLPANIDNPVVSQNSLFLHGLNYNYLRSHPYFNNLLTEKPVLNYSISFDNIHSYVAIRIPKLKEICIRAVGKALLLIADESSHFGGRSRIDWMQVCNVYIYLHYIYIYFLYFIEI